MSPCDRPTVQVKGHLKHCFALFPACPALSEGSPAHCFGECYSWSFYPLNRLSCKTLRVTTAVEAGISNHIWSSIGKVPFLENCKWIPCFSGNPRRGAAPWWPGRSVWGLVNGEKSKMARVEFADRECHPVQTARGNQRRRGCRQADVSQGSVYTPKYCLRDGKRYKINRK